MKIYFKAFTIAIIASLILSACKKDDDGGGGEPFSQNTVEEDKQIVENSAMEMVAAMDDMKDLETTDAAVSLGNLLDMADPMDANPMKSAMVSRSVDVLRGLKDGSSKPADLAGLMKSPVAPAETPLMDEWLEIAGIYEWNPEMEKWNYTATSDQVTFKFPSTEGGMSNDATLKFYDFTTTLLSTPIDEEYDGDVPTGLKMNLMVGSSELVTFSFSAAYNTDGVPNDVRASLTIETFTLSAEFSSSNTSISSGWSFTQSGKILVAVNASAKGDFTETTIDNSIENDTPEDVIHSASGSWQLFDIAIKADVNVKDLIKDMDAAWPDDWWENPNFNEKAATQKEADAINKHLDLRAVNVANNLKIAEVEAYVVEENYYGDYYDYWVDMRLKFGDGSYVDFETYFETGFEDVVGDINDMIAELNNEYNWDLETIDY